ncbi:MAG: hypothetical protein ACKOQ1_07560, partial [Actinomycetota bacterium]
MQRIVLRSGDVVATVDVRHGARLASLRFGETEVLVTAGSDSVAWGSYPMVPYAGRVRDAEVRFAGLVHELEPNAGRHAMHDETLEGPMGPEAGDERCVVDVVRVDLPWSREHCA